MKPLQLKDYTPPKGFMITREATLAERKQIGRKTLVKILTPDIWQMLYELKGKSVRTQYRGTRFEWCIGRLNGDLRARSRSKYNAESFYNYTEFEDMLMWFDDSTYVQRLWKLCHKALRDEKSLQGNARKEEAMKHLRETMAKREERKAAKPVKIKIDIEIEAWL